MTEQNKEDSIKVFKEILEGCDDETLFLFHDALADAFIQCEQDGILDDLLKELPYEDLTEAEREEFMLHIQKWINWKKRRTVN